MQQQTNLNITILDTDTNQEVQLEQKEANEVHRTLGAWKTISGNQEEQLKVLLEKSNNLATKTKLGQLTRFQACRAYTSIYIPAMTYSLVTTNATLEELHKIQSKALFAFLPAMGYEPTFPRSVVHGNRKYGGINIGQLYTEMMIAKIGSVLEHTRANTELGKLMILNINWTQLHTGVSKPIFEYPQKFPYLRNNWFLHLTTFLQKIQANIVLKDIWHIQYERINDTAIMDKITTNSHLKNNERRIFNNWRIYFQVTTLSDIASTDGQSIHPYYWKYHQLQHKIPPPRKSKNNWPIQQSPDISTFRIWRKGLKTTFNVSISSKIPNRLGDWTTTPSQSNNIWQHYYDPNTNVYIQQKDNTFWCHETKLIRTNRKQQQILTIDKLPEEITNAAPETAYPILQINETTTAVTTYLYSTKLLSPNQQHDEIPTTFDQHIAKLSPWRRELIQHWNSVDIVNLKQTIENILQLSIASDGSYDPETGCSTYGVVIANSNTELMSTMGYAPTRTDLRSSFRAELYGLLAAIVLLNETITFYNIKIQPNTTTQIYIDNKGVGQRINKHRLRPIKLGHFLQTDMDIELTIHHEINYLTKLGIKINQILHVKAHQDEIIPIYLLKRDAELNIMADELATVA